MEEQVYNYLIMNHIGKDNLIKNVDLRKRFNIGSDKSMRKIIQNIREDDDLVKKAPPGGGGKSVRQDSDFGCNDRQRRG